MDIATTTAAATAATTSASSPQGGPGRPGRNGGADRACPAAVASSVSGAGAGAVAADDADPDADDVADDAAPRPLEATRPTAAAPRRPLTLKESCMRTVASPRFVLGALVYVAMLATAIGLIASGVMEQAADELANLGFAGHAIMLIVYLFVCAPFGWGYSVITTVCGYTWGWLGLATAVVGGLVGAIAWFLVVRQCLGEWFHDRIHELVPRWRRLFLSIEHEVTQKNGWWVLVGLRFVPLTNGSVNALIACTDCSLLKYTLTTCATVVEMVAYINIGVILRRLGDLSAETDETSTTTTVMMALSISMSVVLLVAGTLFGRRVMRQITAGGGPDVEDFDDVPGVGGPLDGGTGVSMVEVSSLRSTSRDDAVLGRRDETDAVDTEVVII